MNNFSQQALDVLTVMCYTVNYLVKGLVFLRPFNILIYNKNIIMDPVSGQRRLFIGLPVTVLLREAEYRITGKFFPKPREVPK